MSRELEHIDEQLKRVEREEQSLSSKLVNLREQRRVLLLRKAEAKHGVKIGSIVRYKGVEHRVTHIDVAHWYNMPWVEGNPKRKDGKFGTARRNLYNDWELVKEID